MCRCMVVVDILEMVVVSAEEAGAALRFWEDSEVAALH